MARFKKDATAQKALANTAKLADMKAEDFDTVFYAGGHGPMWDLVESAALIAFRKGGPSESCTGGVKPADRLARAPARRHVGTGT
jgi:hypothetical protein